MELQRTPLLRLVLPFVIGVLISYYFPLSLTTTISGFSISFLFIGYFVWANSKTQSKLSLSTWVSIPIYFALFFSGCFASFQSNALNNGEHIAYKNNYKMLLVRVITPPEEKAKTNKIIVNVAQVWNNDTITETEGKVLLYLSKKEYDSSIKYGDYLLIKNKLKPPLTAIGNDSFNYAKWLSHQNIYHQAFLRKGDYSKTNHTLQNPILAFAFSTREYLNNVLRANLPDSNTYSIASAILLGLRNNINQELNNAYIHTGTIHILAVSGLHVGAIYFALLFLLSFLPKQKWTNLLKVLALLTILWLYALLTGLSPSVVRATIMFSFIAVGEALNRKPNLFNSLAAAALFTLAIDANAIFSIGFQLSYLAVAGIGLLYSPLVQLLSPKTWLFSNIWKLLCVSFVAQVATAPLAIYYFHQFPNYFLVSNLFIVPLAMLSVYLGLLLLLASASPIIPIAIGKGLHTIFSGTNFAAKSIEALPYSYMSGLYINIWDVILIYSCIISIYLYLKTKKAAYIIYILAALISLILFL